MERLVPNESWRSKHQLATVVRTHHGHGDNAYKNFMNAASNCLKDDLAVSIVSNASVGRFIRCRKIFGLDVNQHQPVFKLAFEHFRIHAGCRAALDRLEKGLNLDGCLVEAAC